MVKDGSYKVYCTTAGLQAHNSCCAAGESNYPDDRH